jgi:hypothetical protein
MAPTPTPAPSTASPIKTAEVCVITTIPTIINRDAWSLQNASLALKQAIGLSTGYSADEIQIGAASELCIPLAVKRASSTAMESIGAYRDSYGPATSQNPIFFTESAVRIAASEADLTFSITMRVLGTFEFAFIVCRLISLSIAKDAL